MSEKNPICLKATDFKEANFTFTAPKGHEDSIHDLRVYRDRENQTIISRWKIPFLARIRLLLTGELWLWIVSNQQPPVSIIITNPFKK